MLELVDRVAFALHALAFGTFGVHLARRAGADKERRWATVLISATTAFACGALIGISRVDWVFGILILTPLWIASLLGVLTPSGRGDSFPNNIGWPFHLGLFGMSTAVALCFRWLLRFTPGIVPLAFDGDERIYASPTKLWWIAPAIFVMHLILFRTAYRNPLPPVVRFAHWAIFGIGIGLTCLWFFSAIYAAGAAHSAVSGVFAAGSCALLGLASGIFSLRRSLAASRRTSPSSEEE